MRSELDVIAIAYTMLIGMLATTYVYGGFDRPRYYVALFQSYTEPLPRRDGSG